MHVSVVSKDFFCRAEGCRATGYEGSRPQKEFNNGAKLVIGGEAAKRLVQTGAWPEVMHLVGCRHKFAAEELEARFFI